MMYMIVYNSKLKIKNERIKTAITQQFSQWAVLSDNVFIVVSDKNATMIRTLLRQYVSIADSLLITRIMPSAAWLGYSSQINDWLHSAYKNDEKKM